MNNIKHKWVRIQAYKHDGALHRIWSHNYVMDDNEDYFVLVSNRSYVIESNGRKWHTKEPSVFIFSKKKWFNVIAMFKNDGSIVYYVNMASPSLFHNGFIKFIDYDLDIKLYGDGFTRLLDVGEYRKHADSLGYPEKIKEILSSSIDEIYTYIQNHKFPFNDEEIRKIYDRFLNEETYEERLARRNKKFKKYE